MCCRLMRSEAFFFSSLPLLFFFFYLASIPSGIFGVVGIVRSDFYDFASSGWEVSVSRDVVFGKYIYFNFLNNINR